MGRDGSLGVALVVPSGFVEGGPRRGTRLYFLDVVSRSAVTSERKAASSWSDVSFGAVVSAGLGSVGCCGGALGFGGGVGVLENGQTILSSY